MEAIFNGAGPQGFDPQYWKSLSSLLFDQNPNGVFFCTETGQLVDANPAFYRLAGYKRAEIQGIGLQDVFPSMGKSQLPFLHSEKGSQAAYNLGTHNYGVKPVDFDAFQKVMIHLCFYWLLVNQVNG